DGGAVGVGDDAVVFVDLFGVDFGDDQRNAVFHSEGAGVVDDNRPGGNRGGGEFLADAPAGGEEGDLNVSKTVLGQLFNGVRLAFEFDLLAGASGAGQQLEVLGGEVAFGQHG